MVPLLLSVSALDLLFAFILILSAPGTFWLCAIDWFTAASLLRSLNLMTPTFLLSPLCVPFNTLAAHSDVLLSADFFSALFRSSDFRCAEWTKDCVRLSLLSAPVIHFCSNASAGVSLLPGSQTKHFLRKSMKSSLAHLRMCSRVLLEGFLACLLGRGLPLESKNTSALLALYQLSSANTLSNPIGGAPITSMIRFICSVSDSPGNMGTPMKSSTKMQPKLHMSMAVV